jgi:hypothetical protein
MCYILVEAFEGGDTGHSARALGIVVGARGMM